MKIIALTFLFFSGLFFVQAAELGKNQFTTKIEDVDCVVRLIAKNNCRNFVQKTGTTV
jgi:hypothetical protein